MPTVEPIHDDEPDVGEHVVRALLADECPEWATAPIEYLATTGTSNALWRVRLRSEPDVIVRLPRRRQPDDDVLYEVSILEQVRAGPIGELVTTPRVRHVGEPHTVFPHRWSVLEWITGADFWDRGGKLGRGSLDLLGEDLAVAVSTIREATIEAAASRPSGSRGGPIGPLLDRLEGWLASPEWNAGALVDVPAVRRLMAQGFEIDDAIATGFVHGDLIPGNLLVADGRLSAIVDWGGAGHGDLAQDLAPAWAVLDRPARQRFRDALGVDDATWLRGRIIELEHAVGGVLYYRPKQHPLGEVMERTLDQVLGP